MIGLGKMGLSHLSMVRAHPGVVVVAACDTSSYLTDVLSKYAGLKCYSDLDRMLSQEQLDAVFVSTPSRLHAAMVEKALNKGLHVFCEKPFVLDLADGERLAQLAESKGLVNQVGYHFRFVGAFQEAARVVASGALGKVHHVRTEAYGPVVLRAKGGTWRSARNEGGGVLYDYACHAIDLVNFVVAPPAAVSGVILNKVFSQDVDDEVYCSMHFTGGLTGQLAANWSDESYRKMSTRISVWGSNGRVTADRQECQIYLRDAHAGLPGTSPGWTVRYTTELTEPVWFYLRGEEYSGQVDYFVQSILQRRTDGMNSFRSALQADEVVAMIQAQRGAAPTSASPPPPTQGDRANGLWTRIFG